MLTPIFQPRIFGSTDLGTIVKQTIMIEGVCARRGCSSRSGQEAGKLRRNQEARIPFKSKHDLLSRAKPRLWKSEQLPTWHHQQGTKYLTHFRFRTHHNWVGNACSIKTTRRSSLLSVHFSADLCRPCLLALGSGDLKEWGWLQSTAVDNLTPVSVAFYTQM